MRQRREKFLATLPPKPQKPRATAAEQRFLDLCEQGEGWAAPAQLVMVRQLAWRGLIQITDETRYNPRRGTTERRCLIVKSLTKSDTG